MAIICIKLGAVSNLASKIPKSLFGPEISPVVEENMPSRASNEEALRMGEYRDILNLTRVLIGGPKSKADVDIIIERYFSQSLRCFTCFMILASRKCVQLQK